MPVKILMVCLGNICRSPLAEAILASKLPEEKFILDSAGTSDYHVGKEPDIRSIAIAKKNGLNIYKQKARQFTEKDFSEFDYIYVMDQNNQSDILKLAKSSEDKAKVNLILNELFPQEKVDVPDPYYGVENGFEKVYHLLNEVCEVIAEKLQKQ
jgi:protein-tyrosine phosphatase